MPDAREPRPLRDSPLAHVAATLRRLRTRARVRLVGQRLGLIIAAAAGAAILLGGADYLLRTPSVLRLALLLLGAAAFGVAILRLVVPALRFAPSLTEVALRAERLPEVKAAGLETRLASGLELSARPGDGLEGELSAQAATDAAARFAAIAGRVRLLDARHLRRTLAALLAAALPLGALWFAAPDLLGIGARRVLAPWTGASWPKRTGVVDASRPPAHAINNALPLRAIVTRTNRPMGATDVHARFRLIIDGREGPLRRATLTPQRRLAETHAAGGTQSGELYERLIEPATLADAEIPAESRVQLEYWFETEDDRTAPWRVTLVEPPAVHAATVSVAPPDYAADVLATRSDLVRGTRDAGAGRDERAATGPILGGSRVVLDLTINKPVPTPADRRDLPAFLERTAPGLELQPDLAAAFDGVSWRIAFTARSSLRVPIVLRDEHGIESALPAVYRFDTVEDRPPTAAVIDPGQDESILPTAVLTATGEGRDDVALASVTLRRQTARTPAGSAGAPAQADAEPVEIATVAPSGGAAQSRASAVLSIQELGVGAGDEVWLTARVTDILGAGDPARAVVSPVRRLRVISESELVEQIRVELSGVRDAAIRLVQDQERLSGDLARAGADARAAADQRQLQRALSDRLSPVGDVLSRLRSRTERNRLDDRVLAGLLDDAATAVADAAHGARRAEDALGGLASRPPAASPDRDLAEAGKGQREVQDALTQLAEMLDRGQDTWAVRRAIERLLNDQRQVTAQTRAAAGQTQGQRPDQLTPEQREDLARLARRQQELSQRTGALTETLEERADQMRETDPSQAQTMQAAADQSRQAGISGTQQQAAEQIEQNQTSAAQQMQEQAEQALERMAAELDRAQQRRDEALRRLLADLMQSLDRLIADQTAEITRLGQAVAGAQTGPLDVPMIALNRNTLALAANTRESREAAGVADLIDAAGVAQSAAIVSIRLPDLAEADAGERQALARLKEAREEADRLQRQTAQREAERKRAELLKAYQEALELQTALNAETAPIIGKEPGRRERTLARRLSERQSSIRDSLARLREQTSELADSGMFDYAHRRLDQAATHAADTLGEGLTPATVGTAQQTVARVLHALVEALRQEQQDRDQFRDAEGEEGGGAGQGGQNAQPPLIPPIAELKLLRMMQEEASQRTRELSRSPGDAAALADVAALQRELNSCGNDLIDKMTPREGPAPPMPEAPDEPEPEARP